MHQLRYHAIIDQITQHPETWNQRRYHCVTAHCVAGWAQIHAWKSPYDCCAWEDARIWLDLSFDEARYLFDVERTLDELLAYQGGVPTRKEPT